MWAIALLLCRIFNTTSRINLTTHQLMNLNVFQFVVKFKCQMTEFKWRGPVPGGDRAQKPRQNDMALVSVTVTSYIISLINIVAR